MVLSISKYVVKKKSIFDDINHRYAVYFKDVTREKLQIFGRLCMSMVGFCCIIFHKHVQTLVCRHLIIIFI